MLAGIVCAAGLTLTSLAASSNVSLRVLSLNVLNDDTKNARFPYIRAVIDDLQPDIFGFQECREGFSPLVAQIQAQGYASAVDTLADDPLKTTIVNCVPIFYRTDRFTLLGGCAPVYRQVSGFLDEIHVLLRALRQDDRSGDDRI